MDQASARIDGAARQAGHGRETGQGSRNEAPAGPGDPTGPGDATGQGDPIGLGDPAGQDDPTDLVHLVGPAAAARIGGSPRSLDVADLEVGVFGVLQVVVDQVHPTRVFDRKRGGQGMLCRVTLSDTTGAIDLVLWDDEIRLTRDGPLQPGDRVRLRGATVKAGYRGGLELGLGSAVVETVQTVAPVRLQGILKALGATEVVPGPDGPAFKAEAVLETEHGPATVVAWDDVVKTLQGAVGARVDLLDVVPHPALPGYWIAGRGPR